MTKEQQDADLVIQMLKTPGWRVLVKRLAERQETFRHVWLNESNPVNAETIRQKAIGLNVFLREIASVLVRGKSSLPPQQKEQGEPNGK